MLRKWNTPLILVLYAVAASGLPIAAHLSHVDSDAGHTHSCADHHTISNSAPPQSNSHQKSDPRHDEENCAVCFAYTVLKQATGIDVDMPLLAQLPPPVREPVRSDVAPHCVRVSVIAPRAPPTLG